jgi:RHS repeat-associated protein
MDAANNSLVDILPGSFGEDSSPPNSGNSIFGFPGQYYDKESALNWNYHRYYDPIVGAYITRDPIGLLGGINSYNYVGGRPTGDFDPTGLVKFDNHAPGDSPGHAFCDSIKDDPNKIIYCGHGQKGGIIGSCGQWRIDPNDPKREVKCSVPWKTQDREDVVNKIMSVKDFDLKEIYIYSCESGASDNGNISFAQRVANRIFDRSGKWIRVFGLPDEIPYQFQDSRDLSGTIKSSGNAKITGPLNWIPFYPGGEREMACNDLPRTCNRRRF